MKLTNEMLKNIIEETIAGEMKLTEQQKTYTVEPAVEGKSRGEKAESFICFGMRLGPPDSNKFSGENGFIAPDQINPHPLLKGANANFFYPCIKIGQAIARDQGKADPAAQQAGAEEMEMTPLAQEFLKPKTKGVSKTDIVAFGNNVSVKMGQGAQLEAIEAKAIRLIMELGAQKVGATEKIAQEAFRVVKESLGDQLDRYRTGDVSTMEGGGTVINALYKLHDEEVSDQDALDFLKQYSKFEPEELTQIQEFIKNLFQSPLFRTELIRQAATGAYKFPEGSPAVPTHMLIFNADDQSYYYDTVDNWLKGASTSVKIEVRTGRSAAAPADDQKPHYSPKRDKTWSKNVQPKLDLFASEKIKFAKPVANVKAELEKAGVEFLEAGAFNKYNYELVKYAADQVSKGKWSNLSKDKKSKEVGIKTKDGKFTPLSLVDFIKAVTKDFESQKTIESDGKRVFKGRSGRLGTDTGEEEGMKSVDDLDKTPEGTEDPTAYRKNLGPALTREGLEPLEEGVLDWVKTKFKSAVALSKKLLNKIKDVFKKLPLFKTADALGTDIEVSPGEIKVPAPTMSSVAGGEPQQQKEHLTITHGSYNMLTEMIENLMSEE